MRRISIFALVILACLDARASTDEALDRARTAYQDGDFAAAIAFDRRALEEHGSNADVWFNMGDAHYRLGEIGRSIFCFRKVLLLDPDHADAARNLAFVRTRRVDKVETRDESFGSAFLAWATDHARVLFTLADFALFLAVAGLLFGRRRALFRNAAIGAVAALLCAGALLFRADAVAARDLRVVIAPKADVTSAPRENLPILVVHDGLEVEARRASGGFVEIAIGDGSLGWVREEALSERIE